MAHMTSLKIQKASLITIVILLCTQFIFSETFPTPKNLKDNVAFWKLIYTETSMTEGLLHDRNNPLVIFSKITITSKARRQRTRIIKKEKARIKSLLHTINTQPESNWSNQAKKIVEKYKKHAPAGAITSASSRIRFQQGQKERFKKGLYRSGAYLDSIRVILKQFGVPQRLIYLPHVESSFNAHAYSKVGAAGLWQFMRSTGKRYLKINYSIDERRDPILSTYAAAKLLSHNYSVIKSWPLAITAYNHGLNGMKKAVAQTGSRDIGVIIQKHKSRSFQFASKNFYGCFLAASEIAADAKKYFPDLTYAPTIKYHDIKTEFYIKPSLLSSLVGISKEELHNLNLAIRPVVFSQNRLIPKGSTIHIPKSVSLVSIGNALNNLPDSLKIKTPPKPSYYKVRRGDNLYGIAKKLRVSARQLASVNNISKMNRIYAGQILRIPGTVRRKTKTVIKKEPVLVAEAPLKKEEKKKKKKTVRKEKPIVSKPQIVQQEEIPDTLKDILMATAEAVPQANVLVKTTHSYKFDVDIYNLDAIPSPNINRASIRISVNETLGHYADWLNIPTQSIRRANHMGRRSYIRINQKLIIPADQASLEQFQRKRLEYHMALEEDFYNQFKVTELKPKHIERGENLWDICNSSEGVIPLWLLKKYNKHVDFSQLFPKTQIWMPVVEIKTENDLKQEANQDWKGIHPAYAEPVFPEKPFGLIR